MTTNVVAPATVSRQSVVPRSVKRKRRSSSELPGPAVVSVISPPARLGRCDRKPGGGWTARGGDQARSERSCEPAPARELDCRCAYAPVHAATGTPTKSLGVGRPAGVSGRHRRQNL